jgi:TolB-like protein/DNA-binding SARP family transcriptional activator/Flp pilus assembly protein TadD
MLSLITVHWRDYLGGRQFTPGLLRLNSFWPAAKAPMVRVKLFAGACLEDEDRPLTGPATQRRRLALLALLAAHPGGVSRERLVGVLWPDRDVEHARNLLSQAVYAVRRQLGEEAIVAAGDELRLDCTRVACDALEFAHGLAAGEAERAATVYTGTFLDGFFLPDSSEFGLWLDGARERYRRSYCSALELLATNATVAGEPHRAAEWLRRLAAEDPGNARVALRLMEALDAAGDRAAAIRQARIHAAYMRQELDAVPDPEIEAVAHRLRLRPTSNEEAARYATRRTPGVATTSPAPASDGVGAAEDDGNAAAGPAAVAGGASALRPSPRLQRPLALLLAAVVLVASGWLMRPRRDVTAARAAHADPAVATRLVVLPFANLGGDPDEQYFSDGLTEELIAVLSRVQSLRVVARSSSLTYRTAAPDVREIGRSLDVRYAVEGSVSRERDRVRVWARLLDTDSGVHLWSRSYDRELADVFAMWADVAGRIATSLATELSPDERARLIRPHRPSPQAHALYLKGRHSWQQRTATSYQRAIEYFDSAIGLAPEYADAHAGLAITYVLQSIQGHEVPQVASERARTAALRALELDDELPEAYAALGGYLNVWAWDVEGAERAWLRAIELDPGYAYVRHIYALLLESNGRVEEALEQRRKAVELDPLDPHLSTRLARLLLGTGRGEQALQSLQDALDIDSLYWPAHTVLGDYLAAGGRLDEAITAHRRAVELSAGAWAPSAALARGLVRAGSPAEARRLLATLRAEGTAAGIYSPRIAEVHAVLNEWDAAMAWLDLAFRQKHPSLALLTPHSPLAADPRYFTLLRRVGRRL